MTLNKFNQSTFDQYAAYLKSTGLSDASIQRKLSSLSSFQKFLVKKKYISSVETHCVRLSQTQAGFSQTQNTNLSQKQVSFPQTQNTNLSQKQNTNNNQRDAYNASLPKQTEFVKQNIFSKIKNKIKSSLFQPKADRPLAEKGRWVSRYIAIFSLFAISASLGYTVYRQTFLQSQKNLAYSTASNMITAGRFLSFQGRLTDSAGNPIISSTNIVFKLFDVGNTSSGNLLYTSGTGNSQTIVPDENGIFSVTIGKSHGSTIPSSVFTENAEVWLEITAGAETMNPRQQIATVAYALNAETLQGLPPSASGIKNTVLVIGASGNIMLGETSPSIISTSGTFGLEGQAILIKASDGSGGNITINPDANGQIKLITEGTGVSDGFINATNSNLSTGNLFNGTINNLNKNYNFINFSNYSVGTSVISRFSVDAYGNTFVGGTLSTTNLAIGSSSLVNNLNADLLDGYHASNFIGVGLTGSFIYTADNGLTLAGNNFKLGGLLSQNTDIGFSGFNLTFSDAGSTFASFSASGNTFYNPTSFTSGGDVSIAYDLNFTNSTNSNINTAGPFSINAGGVFSSSNLNLKTYNSGRIVLDSSSVETTGNLTIGGTFVSVGSTNLVTNLNSDLLDGQHSSYYLGVGSTGNFITTLSAGGTGLLITGSGIGRTITNTGLVGVSNGTLSRSGSDGTYTVGLNLASNNSWSAGIGVSGTTNLTNALNVGGTAYFASNVGIGTTNPLAKLQVNGDVLVETGHFFGIGATDSAFSFHTTAGGRFDTNLSIGGTLTTTTLNATNAASTTVVTNLNSDLFDGQHGSYYLGIGSTGNFLTTLTGGTDISITGSGIGRTINNTSTLSSVTGRGSSTSTLLSLLGGAYFGSTNQSILKNDGSVGIGTTNPGTFKLNVNGSMNLAAGQTYNIGGTQINLNNLSDVLISTPITDQILRYNGTNWINGAETTVNGGAGVDFFYVDSPSDIATYTILNKIPDAGGEIDETVIANNNRVLFDSYASPSPGFGGSQIDPGVWTFDIWAYVNDITSGNSSIDIDVYKRTSGGTETLLFSVNSGTLDTTLGLSPNVVTTIQQAFAINSTDRLVTKVYGKTTAVANRTIHFVHGGTSHYSHLNTPLVVRHNDLAGLQGGTASEYYHLTATEYAGSGTGTFIRQNAPIFTGGIGVSGDSTFGNNLTINGTLALTQGAANGYILQSDASGNAAWVAANTVGIGTTYAAGEGLSLASNIFSLDLAHINTWTGLQTFSAGVTTTNITVGNTLTATTVNFTNAQTTTVVTNLNADLLDGISSAGFVGIGQTGNFITTLTNGVGISISGTGVSRTISVDYDTTKLSLVGNELTLNLGSTNTWTGKQTFANATVGGTLTLTGTNVGTGTTALFIDGSGVITKRALGAGAFSDGIGTTYAAGNGLTLSSGIFKLGGLLSQNTDIGFSGFSLTFSDGGSTFASFSASGNTFYNPTTFTSSGDVSIAYDLNFTNSAGSNINTAGPLSINTGEVFNSSNLTLKTYNSGQIVLDSSNVSVLNNASIGGTLALTQGAADGYILQSDASGNAAWVAANTVGVGTSYSAGEGLNLASNIFSLDLAHVNTWTGLQNFNAAGAPFAVGSSVLVTNLNANYLGGTLASGFVGVGQTGNFLTNIISGPLNNLTVTGTGSSRAITLNLGAVNTWTALQNFSAGATTTNITITGNGAVTNNLSVGKTLTATTVNFTNSQSTTVVTNLNADLLDGVSSAGFVGVGQTGNFLTDITSDPLNNLIISGTGSSRAITLNLAATNTWTATQTFGNASIGGTLALTQGAANGYILQSDASGNAAWVAANTVGIGTTYSAGVGLTLSSSNVFSLNLASANTWTGLQNFSAGATATNITVGGTLTATTLNATNAASTTVVTNFNADLLDGVHSSAFLGVGTSVNFISNLTGGTDISITGSGVGRTINNTSTLATVTGRGASTSTLLSLLGGAYFGSTNQSILKNDGSIGIGTTNPSRKLEITGDHSSTRFQMTSNTGQASPSDSAYLSFWASEPGLTYTGAGIGNNINGSSNYGRISTARGGSYIRLLDNEIRFNTINVGGTDTTNLILSNGNTTISKNLTIGVSFVSVGSQNLVTNLNSDLFDGQHSSYYLSVGSTGNFITTLTNGVGISISGTGVSRAIAVDYDTTLDLNGNKLSLNTGNANTWTATQTFGNASIGGTLALTQGAANGYILQSDASGNAAWVAAAGIGGTYTASNGLTLAGSVFKLGGALTENTRLNIGNTEVMYLSTTGNVGIGTTNPLGLLTLNAPDDSVSSALLLTQSNNPSYGFGWYLDQGNGSLYLDRWTGGARGNNLMTTTTSGYVGIGTTNPLYKLQVAGEIVSTKLGVGATSASAFNVSGNGNITGKLNVGTSLTIGSIPSIADNNVVLTSNGGVVSSINTSGWDKNAADNYQNWYLQINGGTTSTIGTGNTVNFIGGTNVSLSKSGNAITINNTTTASNGLSLVGGDFQLGGLLSQNTDIGFSGFSLTFSDAGNTLVSFSSSGNTFYNPTTFTSSGDVSMAYDLNFTNSTASYIKSVAPLYIQAGEVFNSSDLTLKTYNNGSIILDSSSVSIGGTLALTQGAADGYILQSDASGNAAWVAANTVGVGTSYVAGEGLILASNTFSLDLGHTNVWTAPQTFTNGIGVSGAANFTNNLNVVGNIGATGSITGANIISTGNVGFHNDVYYVGVANPMWSFGNASTYGMSYYQGTALPVSDAIGMHFGTVSAPPFIFTASGRLGIGTTNPTQKLDVVGGSIRTDNQLISTVAQGTAPLSVGSSTLVTSLNADLLDGLQSTAFVGTGSTGNFITTLTNGVGISISGTGVGRTISVDYDTTKLSLTGNKLTLNLGSTNTWTATQTFGNASIGGTLALIQGAANGYILQSDASGNAAWVAAAGIGGTYTASNGLTLAGSVFKLGGALTENTRLNIGNTEVMYLSTDGKVGIGTTNPGAKLEIANLGAGSDIFLRRIYDSGTIPSTGNLGMISSKVTSGSDSERARIQFLSTDSGHWLPSTDISFFTAQSNANVVEAMRITSTGNVGIGTTNPGNVLTLSAGSNNFGLSIINPNTTGKQVANLYSDAGAGTLDLFQTNGTTIGSRISGNSGVNSYLNVAGGNVGIGTTNPLDKLQVVGSAIASGFFTDATTHEYGFDTYVPVTGDYRTRFKAYDSFEFTEGRTDTTRMVIASGGNVGIGTTNPTANLQVNGNVLVETGHFFGIGATDSTFSFHTTAGGRFDTNLSVGGTLTLTQGAADDYILQSDASGNAKWVAANTVGVGTTYAAGNGLTLASGTFKLGGALTENTRLNIGNTSAFFINSTSGNIGIGTSAPAAKLHITTAGEGIRIDRTGGIASIKAGATDGYMMIESAGQKLGLNWYVADDVILVNGGGKVGIGTAAPLYKLQVAGEIVATKLGVGATSTAAFNVVGSGNFTTNLSVGSSLTTNDLSLGATIPVADNNIVLTQSATGGLIQAINTSGWDKNAADNYQNWYLQINGGTTSTIGTGNTVNFIGGTNVSLSKSGNAITINNTTTASNGLSLVGGDFQLGGLLSQNTDIGFSGFSLTFSDGGSTFASFSSSGNTFYNPTTFTSSGDVSMAYDLNFTNSTSSTIRSQAPLYIQTESPYANLDINLTAANAGKIYLNSDTELTNNLTVGGTLALTQGAADGYILQSDASGNAAWVAANTVGVGTSYVAGEGLILASNTFSLDLGHTNVWTAPQTFTNGIGVSGNSTFTNNLTVGGTLTTTTLKATNSQDTTVVTNLNADLLDGLSASSFIRDAYAGDWEIASSTNSSVYTAAALEVRELNLGGAQTGALSESPRISFHWSGRVASQIGMDTSGDIRTFDNPGTGYEDFKAKLFFAANGTVGAPAYSFTSDVNTGMYLGGTDILRFSTAGTDRVTIDASGDVGIGTTAPGVKLDVVGGAIRTDSNGYTSNNIAGTGTASYHPGGIYSAGSNWLYGTIYMNSNIITDIGNTGTDFTSGGGLILAGTFDPNGAITLPTTGISGAGTGSGLNADLLDGQHGAYYLNVGDTGDYIQNQFAVDQTANLRITGSAMFGGKVGIGATNNLYLLNVGGTASFNNLFATGNVGIGTTGPRANLEVLGTTGLKITDNAAWTGWNIRQDSTSAHLDISYGPLPATSLLHINYNNGNVGIGTTNPNTALQVVGTVTATQFNGSGAGLTGTGTNFTAGAVSGLTLTSSANGINPNSVTQNQLGYNNSVSLFGQTDGGLYSSAYDSSWIHQIYGDFRTGQIAIRGKNNGTWQPWRTVLDSANNVASSGNLQITGAGPHYITAGNVGIGTTSPLYKLDINGNANISTNLNIGGTLALTQGAATGYVLTSDVSGNAKWLPNTGIGTTYAAGEGLILASNTFSLDLGHTNVWTGLQTFANATVGGTLTMTGTNVLATGTTALFIDGSGTVTKRALGSLAFSSATYDNYNHWDLQSNSANNAAITTGTLVNFTNGVGISLSQTGSTITINNVGIGTTYAAGNGLTLASGTFKLGGALTENTNLTIGNTSAFFINSTTGNVGIGTTTPGAKLNVADSISGTVTSVLDLVTKSYVASNNWTTGVAMRIGSYNSTGAGIDDTSSRIVSYSNPYSTYSSKLQIQTHSGTTGVWNTGLMMDTTGNVGIGTTAPLYDLHVNGDALISTRLGIGATSTTYELNVSGDGNFTGNLNVGSTLSVTTGIDLSTGGSRYISYYGAVSNGYFTKMEPTATATYGTYGPVTSDWALYNRFSGATTRGWIWQIGSTSVAGLNGLGDLQINGEFNSQGTGNNYFAGNVGIGTTNPGAKLTVVSPNPATLSGISLLSGGNSDYTSITIGRTAPETYLSIAGSANHWLSGTVAGDSAIVHLGKLHLGSTVNGQSQITFDTAGNVGIGTTNPTYPLDVTGNIRNSGGDFITSSGAVRLMTSNTNVVFRGVRATTAWSDAVDTQWFQIGNSSDNVAFTSMNGSSANRMLFATSAFNVNTSLSSAAPIGLVDVSNGNTKLFNILATGNVGIGTTNPLYKLDVGGTLNATTIFQNGVPFSAGQWTTVSDDIYFLGVGTTTGNVGIGTTNPTAKLDIVGDVKINGVLNINGSVNADSFGNISAQKFLDIGNTLYGLIPANTDPAKNSLSLASTGSIRFNYNDNTGNHILTGAASRIQNFSNGLLLGVSSTTTGAVSGWDSNLFLNTTGNVGIGTTNPLSYLSVGGTGRADAVIYGSGNNYAIFGEGLSYGVGVYGHSIASMGVSGESTSGYGVAGWSNSNTGIYGSSNTGTGGKFISNSATGIAGYFSSNSGYALITGYGNVGIGTTNPGAKLTLQTSGTTDILNLFEAGGAEVMTVLESGNVGIGTTAPTSGKLEVKTSSGTAIYGSSSSNPGVYGYSNSYQGIRGVSNMDFGIYCSGVYCGGNQAWTNNSDARLKTNVSTLTNPLQKIENLRGVNFTWIDYPQLGPQMGFIAQESLASIPETISTDQNGYYSMQYGPIVALAIEGIKAQQIEIEASESTIASLNQDLSLTSTGEISVNMNVSDEVLASLGYDGAKNEIEAATYSLTDALGQTVSRISQFSEIAAAKIKTGFLSATNIITKNLIAEKINTKELVSPKASLDYLTAVDIQVTSITADEITTDTLTATDATVSTLYADNIISPEGSIGDVMTAKISALRDQLTELVGTHHDASSSGTITGTSIMSLSSGWSMDIASDSAKINGDLELTNNLIIGAKLTVNGDSQFGNAFVSGTFTAGEIAIKDNFIETTNTALYIQPSSTGSVHIMGDTLVIAENGDININGNVTITGSLMANLITADEIQTNKLTSIEIGSSNLTSTEITSDAIKIATDSAQTIIIADSGFGELATASAQLVSNATAGTATLPTGKTEIIITNNKITQNSMIYLTPVGSTSNQVPYIKAKVIYTEAELLIDPTLQNYFTIALDNPLENDISINWWIIN